jgi:predicted O-methyltransferase YrrM
MMSDLLLPGLNKYIDSFLPERDQILREMENYARERNFPVVGPQVGRFLFQLTYSLKPSLIFEMGSGFGYSAYWFCLGAPEARVIITERNDNNLLLAKKWFVKGKKEHQVSFTKGNALDILKASKDKIDIIFIDVDKHEYPEAFSLALNRLHPGGFIVTDNVLWYGKVADPDQIDPDTEAVRRCNELLFNTPNIFSTIIPIRDGIGLTIKM